MKSLLDFLKGLKSQLSEFEIAFFTMFFITFGLIWPLIPFDVEARGDIAQTFSFLGYDLWFNASATLLSYTLSRPWHIIPAVVLVMSIYGFFKAVFTGKCSFLKGVPLLNLVLINFSMIYIFYVPLVAEFLFAFGFVYFIARALSVFAWNTLIAGINKYKNACECTSEGVRV